MDSVYSPTWRLVSLLSWLRLITSSSDRFGAANPSQLCEKYRTSSSSTTPARAPPMTRRSNAARIFQTSRPRRLQFSICVATANNRSSASNIVPPRRPTACCWHSKPILQCLPWRRSIRCLPLQLSNLLTCSASNRFSPSHNATHAKALRDFMRELLCRQRFK